MTEQEAFDNWMTPPMRAKMWTPQTQEAARAAFAAAWEHQETRRAAFERMYCVVAERSEAQSLEIERLNKWADGFADAQLKERQLCEERIRELRER